MKGLRIILLVGLLLSIPAGLTADSQLREWTEQELTTTWLPSNIEYQRVYAKYYGWQMACELTVYRCSDHQIPIAEYVSTRSYGYYEGGNIISLSNKLYGLKLKATMIHEMIHYLHMQEELIEVPGFAKEICWSENEAFTLTDKWFEQIGRPDMKRGPNWWTVYLHCWPYYNPNFEIWEWFEAMLDDLLITLTLER